MRPGRCPAIHGAGPGRSSGGPSRSTPFDTARRRCGALRAAPSKMHDQGDERDDEENMNEAPGDVEYEPAQEPGDKTNDEEDQKQREEHWRGLLFRGSFGAGGVTVRRMVHSTRSPGTRLPLLDSRPAWKEGSHGRESGSAPRFE